MRRSTDTVSKGTSIFKRGVPAHLVVRVVVEDQQIEKKLLDPKRYSLEVVAHVRHGLRDGALHVVCGPVGKVVRPGHVRAGEAEHLLEGLLKVKQADPVQFVFGILGQSVSRGGADPVEVPSVHEDPHQVRRCHGGRG